jgi:hypothetical protein
MIFKDAQIFNIPNKSMPLERQPPNEPNRYFVVSLEIVEGIS